MPPALKKPETEAEDLVSAVMCPRCTLFSFSHHNSPNSLQGFFLKAFQLPASQVLSSPPAMLHNLPNDHSVLFSRMEQVCLSWRAQSQDQPWYSDRCSSVQRSAPTESANTCVICQAEQFTYIQEQIFSELLTNSCGIHWAKRLWKANIEYLLYFNY